MRMRALASAVLLFSLTAPGLPAQELRERATFKGQIFPVGRAQPSPDGTVLASWGGDARDGQLKLWDPATGKEVGECPGCKDSPSALAFSPDGKRLAAAGFGPVRVWDVAARKLIAALEGLGDQVWTLAFSADGGRLAAAAARETRVWDVESGKAVTSFRRVIFAGSMSSLAFSPDLDTLAAPNYQEIELWDVATGKPRALLSEHRGQVCSAAYSPDGKTLIAASDLEGKGWRSRGEVRLWDLATGRERRVFQEGFGSVRSAVLSPDGKVVALFDVSRLYVETDLKVIDVATGRQQVLHAEPGYSFLSLAFTTSGKLLVTGRSADAVRLWEVSLPEEAGK